jgi:hypothetical protein
MARSALIDTSEVVATSTNDTLDRSRAPSAVRFAIPAKTVTAGAFIEEISSNAALANKV